MDTKSIQVTSTVPDVSRELFDTPNKDNIKFQVEKGLTEDVVRTISSQKNEPAWMLEKR